MADLSGAELKLDLPLQQLADLSRSITLEMEERYLNRTKIVLYGLAQQRVIKRVSTTGLAGGGKTNPDVRRFG